MVRSSITASAVVATFVLVIVCGLAAAYDATSPPYTPGKSLALDGSYVMNIGKLHVNITNHGLIGSRYSIVSTYSDAASAQWPGGSENEYLFAAGPWIGGVKQGETLVSTGQYERELRPRNDPRATIYEAKYGSLLRPESRSDRQGARIFEPTGTTTATASSTRRRSTDSTTTATASSTRTRHDRQPDDGVHDGRQHAHRLGDLSRPSPLDIEVVQSAYAWETEKSTTSSSSPTGSRTSEPTHLRLPLRHVRRLRHRPALPRRRGLRRLRGPLRRRRHGRRFPLRIRRRGLHVRRSSRQPPARLLRRDVPRRNEHEVVPALLGHAPLRSRRRPHQRRRASSRR